MSITSVKYDLTYLKFYIRGLYYLHNKKQWKLIQNKQLSNLLNYAVKHCKYFKNEVGELDINEINAINVLKGFPIISKNMITENNWNIYSDEVPKDYTNWRETGGSTGVPLKFPALASSYYVEDVCQMMLYHQMGYRWGDKIAYLGGDRVSEEQQKKNIYWLENHNLPYGKLSYCIMYLNDETFPYFVDSLNKLRPRIIRGYTSSIKDFCRYVKKTRTTFNFTLKGIYLTSESATQEDCEYIESILHCPVWGQYGHTECSIFGIRHPNDTTFYTIPLYGYTEVLDENGTHVDVGNVGEITVTGFNILGMPFIRYKTGDLAVYGGETQYGETILKELLGRSRDFLYDDKGNKVYALSLLFDAGNLHLLDYIKAWQIEQESTGNVVARIIKDETYNIDIEMRIRDVFENKNISISFVYVDEIPKTRRGKHKFIIQNYNKCNTHQ